MGEARAFANNRGTQQDQICLGPIRFEKSAVVWLRIVGHLNHANERGETFREKQIHSLSLTSSPISITFGLFPLRKEMCGVIGMDIDRVWGCIVSISICFMIIYLN